MAIKQPFSNDASHYLTVDARVSSQNVAERYSVISWFIEVTRTRPGAYSAGPGWGYESSASVSNTTWDSGSLFNRVGMVYDWRGPEQFRVYRLGQGSYRVYHDDEGHAKWFVAGHVRVPILGNAYAGPEHQWAPNIGPKGSVASAPTPIGLDLVQQTSMRYRFIGGNNGGHKIIAYQIGYGTSIAQGPRWFANSNGSNVISNLSPATTYHFWSRARNARGWSPWSRVTSARTIAGAFVRVNGVWKEAVPYVKSAGKWKVARPYVKSNGVWKPGQ